SRQSRVTIPHAAGDRQFGAGGRRQRRGGPKARERSGPGDPRRARHGGGGAQKVSDAVSNSDPELLTKLRSAVAGGNSQVLTEGANLLSGLLGGGGLA